MNSLIPLLLLAADPPSPHPSPPPPQPPPPIPMESRTIVIVVVSGSVLFVSVVFFIWACWCSRPSVKKNKSNEAAIAHSVVATRS